MIPRTAHDSISDIPGHKLTLLLRIVDASIEVCLEGSRAVKVRAFENRRFTASAFFSKTRV